MVLLVSCSSTETPHRVTPDTGEPLESDPVPLFDTGDLVGEVDLETEPPTALRAPVLQTTGHVDDVMFSPDGTSMITRSGSSLSLLDVRTGAVRSSRLVEPTDGCRFELSFASAGGRLLVTVPGRPHMEAMDGDSPAEPARWSVWDIGLNLVTEGVFGVGTHAAGSIRPAGDQIAIIERESPEGYYEYCPDNEERSSENERARLVVYDASNGRRLRVIELGDFVPSRVRWSPTGRRLLLHDGARFQLRNPETGALVASSPEIEGASWTMPRFRPDGGAFASRKEDGEVRVWGSLDGRLFRTLVRTEAGRVNDVMWSSNGARLMLRSGDRRFTILDTATGTQVATYELQEGANVTSLSEPAWAPDASVLYLATADGIHAWSGTTGAHRGTILEGTRHSLLSPSPDGSALVVARDNNLVLWDFTRGEVRWRRSSDLQEVGIWRVETGPNGTVVIWPLGSPALLWNPDRGLQRTPCDIHGETLWDASGVGRVYSDYDDGAASVCRLSTDGRQEGIPYTHLSNSEGTFIADLESGQTDMAILNADSLEEVVRLSLAEDERLLELSNNGRLALVRGPSDLHLVDTMSGRRRGRLPASGGEESRVSFVASDRNVLVQTNTALSLYRLPTFRPLYRSQRGPAVSLSFDSDRLAFFHDSAVYLLDVTSGRVLGTVPVEAAPDRLAFVRGGRRLLVVHGRELRMWDVERGRVIASVRDLPSRWVPSPNGETYIECRGAELALTSIHDGIRTPFGECSENIVFSYSPDGRLITVGERGSWRLCARDGSRSLTIRIARRGAEGEPFLLVSDRDGTFQVFPQSALEHIRVRSAGPITSSELLPASRGGHRSGLLREILALPTND